MSGKIKNFAKKANTLDDYLTAPCIGISLAVAQQLDHSAAVARAYMPMDLSINGVLDALLFLPKAAGNVVNSLFTHTGDAIGSVFSGDLFGGAQSVFRAADVHRELINATLNANYITVCENIAYTIPTIVGGVAGYRIAKQLLNRFDDSRKVAKARRQKKKKPLVKTISKRVRNEVGKAVFGYGATALVLASITKFAQSKLWLRDTADDVIGSGLSILGFMTGGISTGIRFGVDAARVVASEGLPRIVESMYTHAAGLTTHVIQTTTPDFAENFQAVGAVCLIGAAIMGGKNLYDSYREAKIRRARLRQLAIRIR